MKLISNSVNKANTENYIIMKDMYDNIVNKDRESTKKNKQKMELKHILDQQVRDKQEKAYKERFLTGKEFHLNKPILQKMSHGRDLSEDQQELIIE